MKIKKHPLLLLPWLIIIILIIGYYMRTIANTSDGDKSTNSNSAIKNSIDNSLSSNKTAETSRNNPMPVMALESIRDLPAGTIINKNSLGDIMMKDLFYYEKINDDVLSRIKGISYGDDCTIPLEDLRYVRVLYYGYDGETHIGEVIVNVQIAQDIVDIFAELYQSKYPIGQMVLVDEYNGDDNASMAANNTSSFNYRTVPGATHLSKHAYGLAIDINPLYNPYVQYTENETIILPEVGTPYADRSLDNPYYIKEGDVCYKAFTKRGFTWGGFWTEEPDYQHFQKVIEK